MIKYSVVSDKNVVVFVIYGSAPFKDVTFPLDYLILETTMFDIQLGDLYQDGVFYHPDGSVCSYIPNGDQYADMPDAKQPDTINGKISALEQDNKELRAITNDLMVADLKREGAIV